MTGIRRRGRELALKAIYSLPDQNLPIEAIVENFWKNFRFNDDVLGDPLEGNEIPVPAEVRKFADSLILGVAEHVEEVDAAIDQFSTNWSLERMARVDLALLRMAAYELMYNAEVPVSVVINEAIEVGKRYGTADTQSFVNGILDKISKSCRQNGK